MTYYNINGISSQGSSSSSINTDSTTILDDDSNEILLENNTKIKTLENSLTSIRSQINKVSNTIQQYETLPSRLTALQTVVSELKKNSVNVLGYTDNSIDLNNVYNTKYINSTLDGRIPNVYDDYSKTIIASDKEVYSTAMIKSISNIMSIPTVWNNIEKTSKVTSIPNTYSTDVIDSIKNKVPLCTNTRYVETDQSSTVVYTAPYINGLAIPSKLLSTFYKSPDSKSVYTSTYINKLQDTIPILVSSPSYITNPTKNAYNTTYIDSLAIPTAICDESDPHKSTSFIIDTSAQDVYNTYYMDIFTNSRTIDDSIMQESLSIKLFDKNNMKNTSNGFYHTMKYGTDAQTYMFVPTANNMVLQYYSGEVSNSSVGTDLMYVSKEGLVQMYRTVIGNLLSNTYFVNSNDMHAVLNDVAKNTGVSACIGFVNNNELHNVLRTNVTTDRNDYDKTIYTLTYCTPNSEIPIALLSNTILELTHNINIQNDVNCYAPVYIHDTLTADDVEVINDVNIGNALSVTSDNQKFTVNVDGVAYTNDKLGFTVNDNGVVYTNDETGAQFNVSKNMSYTVNDKTFTVNNGIITLSNTTDKTTTTITSDSIQVSDPDNNYTFKADNDATYALYDNTIAYISNNAATIQCIDSTDDAKHITQTINDSNYVINASGLHSINVSNEDVLISSNVANDDDIASFVHKQPNASYDKTEVSGKIKVGTLINDTTTRHSTITSSEQYASDSGDSSKMTLANNANTALTLSHNAISYDNVSAGDAYITANNITQDNNTRIESLETLADTLFVKDSNNKMQKLVLDTLIQSYVGTVSRDNSTYNRYIVSSTPASDVIRITNTFTDTPLSILVLTLYADNEHTIELVKHDSLTNATTYASDDNFLYYEWVKSIVFNSIPGQYIDIKFNHQCVNSSNIKTVYALINNISTSFSLVDTVDSLITDAINVSEIVVPDDKSLTVKHYDSTIAQLNNDSSILHSHFEIDGDLTVDGCITQASDIRLKENIKSLDTIDVIQRIKTYSYTFKSDKQHKTHYGVLAQELREICPELVLEDSTGKMSVNYIELIPHMINEIQRLHKTQTHISIIFVTFICLIALTFYFIMMLK